MPADSSAAPEAFEWMLKLRSGGLTAEQQSTFERWLAVSANAEAWARLNRKLDDTFGPVRQFQASHPSMGLAARKAVLQPGRRRNWIKGALVVSGIGFGAGVLLDRSIPLATLGADYRTATGERRTVVLPDGSVLALNARSAVNVRFERGSARSGYCGGRSWYRPRRGPKRHSLWKPALALCARSVRGS